MIDDVDLRQLRYFRAVAERASFGAAARELHVTQPALSRSVRGLERALGVVLLRRGPRGVEATAAGRQLMAEAREIDDHVRASLRRVVRTDEQLRTVRISAAACDVDLLESITERARLLAGRELVAPVISPREAQSPDLRSGATDLAVLRQPFDASGLASTVITSERRVLLVAAAHHLASSATVDSDSLARESFPSWADVDGAAAAYWAGTTPGGRGWRAGPQVRDAAQYAAVIRMNQAVGLVPETLVRHMSPKGLVTIPVTGIAPNETHLAWSRASASSTPPEVLPLLLGGGDPGD